MTSPRRRLDAIIWGGEENVGRVLTIATLSLLTSSAFAAYATYHYFTGEEEPDVD